MPRFFNKYRGGAASLTVAAKPRVYQACGRGKAAFHECSNVAAKPRFLKNYRGRAAALVVAAKPRLHRAFCRGKAAFHEYSNVAAKPRQWLF
jgi:hypothetical protein